MEWGRRWNKDTRSFSAKARFPEPSVVPTSSQLLLSLPPSISGALAMQHALYDVEGYGGASPPVDRIIGNKGRSLRRRQTRVLRRLAVEARRLMCRIVSVC